MNTEGNKAMHSKKDRGAPRTAYDRSLPEKGVADPAVPVVPATAAGRGPVKSETAPTTTTGTRRSRIKEPFARRPARPSGEEPGKEPEMPDMEPPRRRRGSAAPDTEPGYLVLRMRLSGERLAVIDSRLMPGPLVADRALVGSHAYEVVVAGRLVHTGSLPDLGVQRSFADPQASEGAETGHHFAERRTVDFTVRVPADEVTTGTRAQVEVVLLRVKGEVSIDRHDEEPVSTRYERELHPVARLTGLPDDALPEVIRRRGTPEPRA